ncbi:MAG: hypothetical protein HWD92_05300 [Flavobacteriia bacterium]|nr:hypothetical protein [Flavobacteriia bacterium]
MIKGKRTIKTWHVAAIIGLLIGLLEYSYTSVVLDDPFIPFYYILVVAIERALFAQLPVILTVVLVLSVVRRTKLGGGSAYRDSQTEELLDNSEEKRRVNQVDIPTFFVILLNYVASFIALLLPTAFMLMLSSGWSDFWADTGLITGSFKYSNLSIALIPLVLLWLVFIVYKWIMIRISLPDYIYVRALLAVLLMGIVFTLMFPIVNWQYY